MNKEIFKKIIKVDAKDYEDKQFYDDYYWAIQNVEKNMIQTVDNIANMTGMLFLCVVIIIYVFQIDPWVLIFLIFPVVSGIFVKRNYEIMAQEQMETTHFQRRKNYVKETLFQKKYASEMRMTGLYKVLDDTLRKAVKNIVIIYRKYRGKKFYSYIFVQLFSNHLPFIAACYYGIYRFIVLRNLDAGNFAVLITAIVTFNMRFGRIVDFCGVAQQCSIFAEKMHGFFLNKPDIADGDDKPGIFKELIVDNVSFSYSDECALDHISLKIKQGEKIAIVGSNGAGKSTLIKLLLRLYEPDQGRILYNGTDIRKMDLMEYRKKFGMVFQDNHVFALTLAENIILDNYVEEEKVKIISALEKAGLGELAEQESGIFLNLTKEFDRTGIELSGGQKQKLFIARLYTSDFEIAVLDEPSASLDPISEHMMYEKLLNVTSGKTVLFISHRMSAAMLADKIVVMEQGTVKEIGSHMELLKNNGRYAELFHAQSKAYLQTGGES